MTGRKCLFVNRGFTKRIEGLKKHESDALARDAGAPLRDARVPVPLPLGAHSVAFWDNRCAMHRATFDYHPHVRHGHRVTIKGDRPF